MPKRSPVDLGAVSELENLVFAYWRAAKGKGETPEVREFGARLYEELNSLSVEIRNLTVAVGKNRCFTIHDPKLRKICAPAFRERVLHHGIIRHAGPVLDQAMVFDSFACRKGKGAIDASRRVQRHIRRFPWYCQIDVRKFFDSVDHEILFTLLTRRFKDRGFLSLLRKIVNAYENTHGKGLPIGALTSQYFANYYLDGLDRFILEKQKALGMVRYMDDILWFTKDKERAKEILSAVKIYLREKRALNLKHEGVIQRSSRGVSFCGFRVFAGTIRLTRRRQKRYKKSLETYENAYREGLINASELQRCYDAVKSITLHCDSVSWRRKVHRGGFLDAV